MDILPEKLSCCCKRNEKEQGIEMAIRAIGKETDIISIIRSRRYFTLALKKLLSRTERRKLKE